ncbi:MAG TPA: hypothetical protein VIK60_18390 [Vicinamibacterales bacterium]
MLEKALRRLRLESYEDLARRIDAEPETEAAQGESGTVYQLEFSVVWDDQPSGNLRVLGSIDDGGWRAFAPLSRSFIKARDGTFVGE